MTTTITSWPFSGAGPTSETQWSQLFTELAGGTGVAEGAGDDIAFKATVTGTDMTVHIAAGFAIVRGFAALCTGGADDAVLIDAAHSTLDRYDSIVLRLDPSADKIDLAYLKGTAGAGVVPTPTQTATGIYEMPIATVLVHKSTSQVTSGSITQTYPYLPIPVGIWRSTAEMPSNPRRGTFGFVGGRFYYWDQGQWMDVRDFNTSQLSAIGSYMLDKSVAKAKGGWASTWTQAMTGTLKPVYMNSSALFGVNTSSRRFKKNIVDHAVGADAVLALQPKLYDRKPLVDDDGTIEPATNEYGLIAEEVFELVPEIVTFEDDGTVEGVRYDLLAVALLDVVKRQQAQLDGLHEVVEGLMAR